MFEKVVSSVCNYFAAFKRERQEEFVKQKVKGFTNE